MRPCERSGTSTKTKGSCEEADEEEEGDEEEDTGKNKRGGWAKLQVFFFFVRHEGGISKQEENISRLNCKSGKP